MSQADELLSSPLMSDTTVQTLESLENSYQRYDNLDDFKQFTAGVTQLNDKVNGENSLVSGDNLHNGVSKYTAGVSSASKGASQLAASNSSLTPGATQMQAGLSL